MFCVFPGLVVAVGEKADFSDDSLRHVGLCLKDPVKLTSTLTVAISVLCLHVLFVSLCFFVDGTCCL